MSDTTVAARRRAVVVGINLAIAAMHVAPLGRGLRGHAHAFYHGYFSDLLIPFGFYFLLAQVDHPVLRRWEARFFITVLVPSIAETCQYFGVPVLGSTFDVLDYLMYAFGALTAVVVDRQVLARVLGWWA